MLPRELVEWSHDKAAQIWINTVNGDKFTMFYPSWATMFFIMVNIPTFWVPIDNCLLVLTTSVGYITKISHVPINYQIFFENISQTNLLYLRSPLQPRTEKKWACLNSFERIFFLQNFQRIFPRQINIFFEIFFLLLFSTVPLFIIPLHFIIILLIWKVKLRLAKDS